MATIRKIIALIQMYSLISSFGSSCFTMFKWVHMLADVCGIVKLLFLDYAKEKRCNKKTK